MNTSALEDLTVAQMMERWIMEHQHKLKAASVDAYRLIIGKHIVPILGDIPLKAINREILQQFLVRLRGSGLSEKSVWDVNIKLNAGLKWAVEQGYLEHAGYCIKSKAPAHKELQVLSPSQRKLLKDALCRDPNPVNAGILFCLDTGISVGELCALRWGDLDLTNARMWVNKRMQRLSRQGMSGTGPKTRIAVLPQPGRRVTVPEDLLPLIRPLASAPDAYFLADPAGGCVEPRTMLYRLKACAQQCGLNCTVNFNVLHATYIYYELEKGVNICSVVQTVGAKRLAHIGNKYKKLLVDAPNSGAASMARTP